MADTARLGLAEAAALLAQVSETPRLDAELLLAHALGIARDAMLLAPPSHPPAGFDALVARRLAHEPIAYIIGQRGFWTLELDVGPGVLVPRADSETLIEAAQARFGAHPPATILDLGTGSGALLLAALDCFPDAWGVGVDRSAEALAVARRNAAAFGPRVAFVRGDWGVALDATFDLVLCNPPYVEAGAALPREVADWEPASALYAGEDGLDDYRRLAPMLARLIAPAGAAIIEIGHRQGDAVTKLLEAQNFFVERRQDLGGRDRCLVAERNRTVTVLD
jgi:release factor glutamine methyltransferase